MNNYSKKDRTPVFRGIKALIGVAYSIFTFSYSARILGPEMLGKLRFLLSLSGFFSAAALGGIPLLFEDKGRDFAAKNRYTAERLTAISAVISVALECLLLPVLLKADLRCGALAAALAAPIFDALGAEWICDSFGDEIYTSLRSALSCIICALLTYAFIKNPDCDVQYAVITVVYSSVLLMPNIIRRKKYSLCPAEGSDCLKVSKLAGLCVPMLAIVLADYAAVNLGTFMLGLFQSWEEAALFYTGLKYPLLISGLMVTAAGVVAQKGSRFLVYFTAALWPPCAAGLFAVAEDLLALTVGDLYSGSLGVLKVSIIFFIFSVSSMLRYMLKIRGEEQMTLVPWTAKLVIQAAILVFLFSGLCSGLCSGEEFTADAGKTCCTALSAAWALAASELAGLVITLIKAAPVLKTELSLPECIKLTAAPVAGSLVIVALSGPISGLGLSPAKDLLIKVVLSVACYFALLAAAKHPFISLVYDEFRNHIKSRS